METFSAILAIGTGNSLVTREFPAQRPVTRSFDASLILACINGWENNCKAGDLGRHRVHYDAIVMNDYLTGGRWYRSFHVLEKNLLKDTTGPSLSQSDWTGHGHDQSHNVHWRGCERAPLIPRFMGPTWGPSGTDRTQLGPMLAPWILLSGTPTK